MAGVPIAVALFGPVYDAVAALVDTLMTVDTLEGIDVQVAEAIGACAVVTHLAGVEIRNAVAARAGGHVVVDDARARLTLVAGIAAGAIRGVAMFAGIDNAVATIALALAMMS